MIAQILNRDFVMQQMAELQKNLAAPVRTRRSDHPHPELAQDDYQEAAAALAGSLARELADSSGQPGFEPPPAARRGQEVPPLDDRVFISRDPVAGNFQAALELYFREGPGKTKLKVEPKPPGRRGGAAQETAVTDMSLVGAGTKPGPPNRRIFDKFSITDPGWLNSVFAMGVRKLRDRRPFVDRPATTEPRRIANHCRLVLVGDWGSGVPRAVKIGGHMRTAIDQALGEGREVHVAHLGDVYYSGWDYEYRARFFPYWPVKSTEASTIGSYLLNGNHDMYSGGWAYYDALDEARFKPYHQGSSFMALANDHWQIFGLDTAWEDHGLAGSQGDWVKAGIEAAPGKKNLLLSHHQIFSAHEKEGGEILRRKIGPALDTGRVTSWFWGHEHRCLIYGPYMNVRFASCIGHGGVPVYVDREGPKEDPPVRFEMRDGFQQGFENWALFGYAVLDFADAEVTARYYDEYGREQKREPIQ